MKRPKRLYRLGEEYTLEKITERICENSYSVKFSKFQSQTFKVYHFKGTLKPARKYKGLRGIYLHYCFRLGILPRRKQNYARLHYLLKDDLMKMDTIAKETRMLCRYHIDTTQQLFEYKSAISKEAENLINRRKELYNKSRYTKEEEKKGEIKSGLSEITDRLKVIRKEVKLCEGIEKRSHTLRDNLIAIRADENKTGKEMKDDEHRRRRSRADSKNEPRRV